jgi:hypothetical protein
MFQWLGRLPLRPRAWLRPPLSPRRTTDLSLRPGEHGTWSPATVVSGWPMVQLFAEVEVMNTSECRVVLVSARLRKPAAEGFVRLHDRKRGTTGLYPLEPFVSTHASVYFYVPLAEPPAGTTVVGDVGFVDQYGNTHWLEKVRFRGRPLDERI